jgi:octaprenyl-diphosphate synthase
VTARLPAEPPEPSLEALVSRTLGEGAPETLIELLPVLTADLADVDARIEQVLISTYPRLTDAAHYAFSSGGKRIRPLLMAATGRALGLASTRPILSLAAAFQLIHTAALVHDDVIDHAEMRRGRPSLPSAFGLPSSIVTGDYLFVRAFELAADYPRSIILRCGDSCADLVEGEVLQEAGRYDLTSGREHYFRVIERKTAAIVAAALASIAEIAGASPTVVEACNAYGRALGIAFQIRDDLLDVFGDPDLLGKPLYTDFREGNPTLVSLVAYEALEGRDKAEFGRIFSLRRKSASNLARLRSLSEATDAARRVTEEATAWASRAVRALEPLPPTPYRTLLEWLARGAAVRRF